MAVASDDSLGLSRWRRRHFGLYDTPPEVAAAHVRLIDDVLRQRFALAHGLGDPSVVIVDPATGGGAYPWAVLELAPDAKSRLRLFEALPEAAAEAEERLGATVEVRDVLAEPIEIDAPMVVCLGNPPYHRQQRARGEVTPRKGGWIRFGPRQILTDFRANGAGLHLKNLYNDYVYFWRWALWLAFEQRRGPGIVSFITASSYLRGPGFAGMRRWLRRSVDELWVLDLEGEGRGTLRSDNVFDGVQTPVAIAIAARYGSGGAARVHYTRIEGSRDGKLTRLARAEGLADFEWQSSTHEIFRGRDASQFDQWPLLTELFPRQFSGCQMKRTWPIAPTPELLHERWAHLLALPPEDREAAFTPTRDRTTASAPHGMTPLRELPADAPCPEPRPYAYRSFDRQWVLADPRLGDFLRPTLWKIAGPQQLFLTSLLTHPLGPGPAVVATKLVPDLDHFRGSFGGKAVMPLWLEGQQANVAPNSMDKLAQAYGRCVTPRELFAYVYALLATPGYQARYAEKLRESGPRVPLTANADLFEQAVRLGEDVLAVHTFEQIPRGEARSDHIPQEVWEFCVSGLRVVKSWLRYRHRAQCSGPQVDAELLQLLWLLEASLASYPRQNALLDEIVRGRLL